MTTLLFAVLLVLAAGAYASDDGKARVAVSELKAQGVTDATAGIISDRLRNELFKTGSFAVLERTQMEEILKEQGFQQTGCTDEACMVEMGQLLGVRFIVLGGVGKVGSTYTLNARMIDVGTGEIVRVADADCRCAVDVVLSRSTPSLAAKLAGAVAGDERAPRRDMTAEPPAEPSPAQTVKTSSSAPRAPRLRDAGTVERGGTYYTRFSFRYEKGRYLATNYARGTLVPINTAVQVLGIGREEIVIRLVDTKQKVVIINIPKYTKKKSKELASIMFAARPVDLSGHSPEVVEKIKRGEVALGMTKKEVILARGFPPLHATRSLKADRWRYWSNRWSSAWYVFADGKLVEGRGLE